VRQAREMIQSGELGEINAIAPSHPGRLLTRLETRTRSSELANRPKRSGAAGCFGDIGRTPTT